VRRSAGVVLALAVAGTVAASAPAGPTAYRCAPTPPDSAGPFGRGLPPQRAKIGTGHVLTGVVLSALDCAPLRGAKVQFWQAGKGYRYTRAGSATVVTDRNGRFRFEGPYPASSGIRPPHIHIRVFANFHTPLLTRYVPAKGAKRGTIRLVLEPEAL
jgi:protocatechuate 3,4-dioxygenase beta subunit